MKLIKKIGIFAAALALTLAGFSWIAAPSVDLLQVRAGVGAPAMVEAAPVTIDVRG